MGNGIVAQVAALPECDFCKNGTRAEYDAKTKFGPWANLCARHFHMHGIGLGLGRGQKLEVVRNG